MKCLKKWVAKMSQKYGRGTVRTETTLVWLHCLFPQTNICRASVPPDIAHHEVHKVIQPWGKQNRYRRDDGIPSDSSMQKKLDFVVCLSKFWAANWAELAKKVVQFALPSCPNRQGVRFSPVEVRSNVACFFEVVPIVPFCPPSLYSDHKASSHSSFVCFVWWYLVPSTTGRGRQSKLCCSFNNANASILKLHACKTGAAVNRNCLGVVWSCYNSGQTY